eukprot:7278144-Prymnesium_polylepis.1
MPMLYTHSNRAAGTASFGSGACSRLRAVSYAASSALVDGVVYTGTCQVHEASTWTPAATRHRDDDYAFIVMSSLDGELPG